MTSATTAAVGGGGVGGGGVGGEPPAAPRALIADDEPLLRERLASLLAQAWPELEIVAQARNGREALELFEQHRPEVAFLDVHMPGLDGIEVGRALAGRTQLVFVTAYEQYAVKAFEQGALDYLVKPFEPPRLDATVRRLRERLGRADAPTAPPPGWSEALDRLAQLVHAGGARPAYLQWIRASVGNAVRLIPIDEVIFLRSDEKYTLVVTETGEAVIRKPLRELVDELDPDVFAQVHRSVIVNLRRVKEVVRGANETAEVHLRDRSETLPVSRSYLHLFRQM